MLRHVVLFKWKAGVTESEKEAVEEGLGSLPDAIAGIESYEFGADAGVAPDNFDYALVADFESQEGFEAYQSHPRHVQVLREVLRPAISERVAAQYRLEPAKTVRAGS